VKDEKLAKGILQLDEKQIEFITKKKKLKGNIG
jgi:hypothetical protein